MKILFVTNKPNYCHRRFAESVGADFFYVKHPFPDGVPLLSLPINGWFNSRKLPEADVYFAESIMDYFPVYYKNPKGKKILLIAEDTLFQMETMNRWKKGFLIKLFRSADGFIAISDLCKKMLAKYTDKPCRVAYPFPHRNFSDITADLRQKRILFIGRKDPKKGYHKLVKAVKMLREKDPEWSLYLIGECSSDIKKEPGISPEGFVRDMTQYFEKCSFLVHPADFDPCPATVFEAMGAGIIPLITEKVGQADIFRSHGLGKLVMESTEPSAIVEKILSIHGNAALSRKCKSLSKSFSEGKRLKMFQKTFWKLADEIS